jgi:repressor LexA
MEMGERIKMLRKINGFSQEELAQKLELKNSAIQKYENGTVENIKRSKIEQLAKIFNVSPAYIVGWEEEKRSYEIPIYGNIHTSMGSIIFEEQDGYHPVHLHQIKGNPKDYFYLRIRGDSMNQARIYQNDLVLIALQIDVENNDIAVVLINDEEATIKRIIKTNDLIILQPESNNPDHKPTVVTKDMNFNIVGKVVAVSFEL